MKVSVSFLSCKKIGKEIKKIDYTTADYIHIDYIDGSLIEGRKIPFHKIKKAVENTSKRLDVHFMTKKLKKNIKRFASLNVEYMTFHVELEKDIEKYISMIHSYGIKCGLAINFDTPLEKLKPYLSNIEMIIVMSITPGYGGQPFIKESENRLKELREYLNKNKIKVLVSVDGSINKETISKVSPYVDMVVSGSYITNSSDFQEQIDSLKG